MKIIGKKVNKLLIGAVIGTAILGVGGYSMSPKGKGFWRKVKDKLSGSMKFFKLGLEEFKRNFKIK